MEIVGFDIVVDLNDMRMVHRGEQLCLSGKIGRCPVTGRIKDLDGHGAVQPAVPAGQHQPGAARAKRGAEVVAGERIGYLSLVDNHDERTATRRNP